jgi:hypothetical protein
MEQTFVVDWQAAIAAFAQFQSQAKQRIEAINTQIEPLQAERAALQGAMDTIEALIKDAARQNFLETGDKTPHSHISVKAGTKLVYNKALVLDEAESRCVSPLVRVKRELDVRKFEEQYRMGLLTWAREYVVEQPAPAVTIARLGDVVMSEVQNG